MKNAIAVDDKYGEAYFYLGQVENRRNNYQNAIPNYEEALRLGFCESYVYVGLGFAKYNLGRYEDAINDFDEAIETDENCAEAYEFRGESYYLLSEYKKASEDFKKYLELDGANLDAETKKYFADRINQGNSGGFGNLDEICETLGIGSVNKLLKTLFIVMSLQYAIIIGCGIRERNLTGSTAASELAVKAIFIVIIIVANAMENIDALSEFDIRDIVIAIILVHELLSILENAERLGIPVPDWLKNLLKNIKNKIAELVGGRKE